ncbi:MAG: hypothetical protein AAGE01_16635 [Pseudomonadota bacterium]
MRQHGWFELETCDRILVFRLYDAWNMETARAYVDQIDDYCPDPTGGPWALVNDLRRWGFSGLELMATIQERARVNTELGRTHSVFIVGDDNPMVSELVREAVLDVADGVANAFVHSDEEAAAWLAEAAFDTTAYLASCRKPRSS